MFTGIIKEIGVVGAVSQRASGHRLAINAPVICKNAEVGDSVSVDGVCLTVVEKSEGILHFDAISQTLDNTTLKFIKRYDRVNLEPALQLGDGVGGHLVSGHVDEIGAVKNIKRTSGDTRELSIKISQKNMALMVQRGSVAINGISLTVSGLASDFFTVEIIPHTLKATTFNEKRAGDKVNVEFDMIGKYVLRSLRLREDGVIGENFLKRAGFLTL